MQHTERGMDQRTCLGGRPLVPSRCCSDLNCRVLGHLHWASCTKCNCNSSDGDINSGRGCITLLILSSNVLVGLFCLCRAPVSMSATHNGLQGTAKEHLAKNRIQQRDKTGAKRQSEQNAAAKQQEQNTRVRDYSNGRDSPILTQPTTG